MTYRILLVDDEPIEREGLKMMIQRAFPNTFHIFQAANGRIAIEQAELHHPHLIFMDIQMPGLSGIQTIQYLKEQKIKSKFVILTAFDTFSYAQEAVSLNVAHYLLKPAKREQLLTILQTFIQESEQEYKKQQEWLLLHEKVSVLEEQLQTGTPTRYTMDHVVHYVKTHMKLDITLEQLAAQYHMNSTTLSKLFKKEIGMNFVDYVTTLRLERVKELLSTSSLSLKEICFEVGYNDPNYLSRVFKKETGLTPTEYRNQSAKSGVHPF